MITKLTFMYDNVLIGIHMVLNGLMCKCAKKFDIANEIVEILWFEFFFLIILSKLIVKYIIGFGRFVNFLKDQWKCHKRGH
jgi:hypothetical protein